MDDLVPVLNWLDTIPRKAQNKCIIRIERLSELGYELRRPEADYLRDGIYELRSKFQKVNYRILYAYHNKTAVLLHGCTKERDIDPADINIALTRYELFQSNPGLHTYSE